MIREKRRGKLSKRILLQQDNARVHTCKITMDAVEWNGYELIPHPTYSPDLAPSDHFLFPNLKKDIRGRHFVINNGEIVKEMTSPTILLIFLIKLCNAMVQTKSTSWLFHRMGGTFLCRPDHKTIQITQSVAKLRALHAFKDYMKHVNPKYIYAHYIFISKAISIWKALRMTRHRRPHANRSESNIY